MNQTSIPKTTCIFGSSKMQMLSRYSLKSYFWIISLLLFDILSIKADASSFLKLEYASFDIVQIERDKTNLSSNISFPDGFFVPCPGGSGIIGGKAFQDFNYNGLDDQIDAGLAGIEVHIYGCTTEGASQSMGTTTTDVDGTYFFSNLTDGETYRIEFIIPQNLNYLESGFNGADSRTTVQFVNSPSCEANIGLVNPADFCEADPFLAIPCYVNGDPLAAGSGSADEDAFVMFKSSYEGGTPKPTTLAAASEIGSTWGTAYNRETNIIFTSAFLKRHVGLGPIGLGGIYKIDINGAKPVVSPFIDVNAIGINVGTYPSNSSRGLTANINLPNNDSQAFNDVGKKGLGGLCMSEDGGKLYVVNLTENKLHAINIASGTPTNNDVQSYTLPNPNCSGGVFRPFAVRMSGGSVYVGGLCDAESSGNKSDLRAIVYRLNGNSFTEVLNFSLDYTKGLASRSCDDGGWFPWTNQLPETCFMSGSSNVIVHPTPHLTALEFDENGDMILGFTDRMGNQLGFINYPPIGTDATYSVFTGGDILKADRNQDGSFTIENNGTVGNNTTNGADNGEGPGGGEFFYWDVYDIGPNIPRPHNETAQGGLALIKGSGQIISTALDPFGTSVNSGGVNYFDNQTGAVRDPGYRVFRSGSSSPASFSKANGLGDLVSLCGEAPIEIGGRLWIDANENGIQDPCEAAFSGVNVALYDMDGKVNEIITTDANGEYFFNGSGTTAPEIFPKTDYFIVLGHGEQFDNINNVLLDSFFLTTPNTGMGSNPDLNDSDGMISPSGLVDNAFEGWPSIQITTGNNGEVSHDNDAGFFVNVVIPKANISGFVWNDLNENGLQNEGETGIPNVRVSLYASNNNTLILSTSTDANGNYLFENVEGRDYYLVFDASNDPIVGDNFKITLQDIGSDDNLDSDISQSDARVDFEFNPINGNIEFDAGYTLPVEQVIGTVFNDLDEDGLQGNNEPGISGVTVNLNTSDGTEVATTTTDANGNYVFDDIMEGDYIIIVDVDTNTEGIPNFEGTIQNAGDDDFDSDVNPETGVSDIFTHNPTSGPSDIDAGFIEPNAIITGFVWNDVNENGLQNDGENGIPGVDVMLIDGSGNQIASTITDGNGNYEFTAVKSDNYTLQFDASDDPIVGDNYEVTLQDVGSDERFDSDIDQIEAEVTFSFEASEGNADFDAGYILPLANIKGLVFDDENKDGLQGNNEPMIAGVTVKLIKGDNNPISSTTTDENGQYQFNEIMGGTYFLEFDVSTNSAGTENYEGTQKDAGDDDFDSDVDPNTGKTDNFNFNPSDGDRIFDAGYFIGTGTITGTVFNDFGENGLQDPGDSGIGGVTVTVIAPDGTPINVSTSFSDGSFSVDGIPSGTVTVLFDPDDNSEGLENLTPTIKDVNNNQNDGIDSDINPNKESDPFEFIAEVGADIDAGFFAPVNPVMIGDYVFKDCNANGIQEEGEKGIPNIPITLTGINDLGAAVIREMTTNSMGNYVFTLPRPGTYTLDFDIPEGVTGLAFSPKNRGGNIEKDSDVNPISGATDAITLASGENNFSVDAGVIDKSPPLIFNVPPDITVDCNDVPNPPSSVKAVDNCDPSIEVIFEENIIDEGHCPYVIERSWTAVDDCGNSAQRTQRVTVTDTEAPVITIANPLLLGIENGGEIIFDCDNLPEFTAEDVTAVDDCSDVEVRFVDLVRVQGDCKEDGFIIKMTCGWIAEDDCGNRAEFNIVIFVVDTKSPTLINVPEDLTINVDEGQFIPPVANTVTATDNCDEYVRLEMEQTETTGVCGTEIIRTWIGFDDCGNKAIESQKITVLQDCSCPDELVSSSLVWDAACDGSMGGMITLDLTADLNKYDISISPNDGSTNFVGNMFSNLVPGDYVVTVNYEAGETCSETYNFTVATATPSAIEVVAQTQADCERANGSITLSPPNFSYRWNDGGSGAQRNDLKAGQYTVTFTDNNNCEGSQVINISNPEGCECIDFVANLLWEIMPTCNGYTNGQVDIEIVGGTPPFTYQWHDGQTTKDLFGVSGGHYSLTVTDANGCITSLSGELEQPDAILPIETLMNGACGEKGAIDLFISGGTPPYNYNWSNGETTEDLTNLVTGSYSVTVTDANECQGNLTVNINNSGEINVELSSSNPTCGQGNDGSLTALVTGGQNPLSYIWSNGATTSTIENIPAGTYAVMVTDATGCEAMAEMTLSAPELIIVNAIPSSLECGSTTGNIELEINGGTTPYSYSWSNGGTTKDIIDLEEGNYSVTVTDANGCIETGNAFVSVALPINVTTIVQPPNCDGDMGSIRLDVISGREILSYEWSNGATSKDLLNVPPGNYTVTITDGNGCTNSVSAEIQAVSSLTINNIANNPSCAGEAGGSIRAEVSGGTAPYSYVWSNGLILKDITDLMPGEYTVTVTDANGCSSTNTVVLNAPGSLIAEAIPTSPKCIGMVGSIDLTVNGGSGNYTYAWDFGATTKDIEGLISGDYSVIVTDENGCQTSATATINVPTAIEGITAASSPDCDGEGGRIDLTVSGGTSPYTFGWSNGAGTEDLENVAPGSYNVLIKDANGCYTIVSGTVESVDGLSLKDKIINPICAGEAGGNINIIVSGGTQPYTYNWSNGATTASISDLMPGGYSVVITDANGCQLNQNFSLEAPAEIFINKEVENPNCSNDTGKINIGVTGGTAPYTFIWSNGASSEDLNGVEEGDYSVTITDSNGCSASASASLIAPPILSASAEVMDQDCSGDGAIDLTVSGGTTPYSYVWSNGSTDEDLKKVGGGTYNVIISDANDCKLRHEVIVQSTGGIQILVSGNAPSCPNGSDGSLSLNVQGGTQPYSYLWSNNSQAAGLANIPAGNYAVTVTDAKGCSLVGKAVLDSAPEIIATATATNPSCADDLGSIDLIVSGGTDNFTYNWSNGATTKDLNNLNAGGYTVTVTDGNGCIATATAIIEIPTALAISIKPTNPGCDGSIGNIELVVSGGTAPYTYTWSNGSFEQNLSKVLAGTYSVTVVDVNGCHIKADATIDNIDNISIGLDGSSNPTCYNGTDGFINLRVSGGTAPYSFSWTNGATTEDLEGLGAGFYAVTVADARGCKVILDALLQNPEEIAISVEARNPNCPGQDGNINITVMGGTPPYTYSWNTGATTQNIMNVAAGNYQVNVMDAKGCSKLSENISINIPDDYSVSLNPFDIKCYGESNGEIQLTISGSGSYTYAWSNGETTQNIANLDAGTYGVTVTNEKGCQKIAETVVNISPAISLGMTFTNPHCPNDYGAINIDVAGGTLPYTYAWSHGAITEDVTNLPAGDYTIIITDANGCTLEGKGSIRAATQIIATVSSSNLTCAGEDGTIDLSVSGGSGNYSYQWNNGAISQDLTGLTAGNYEVTITDSKGCMVIKASSIGDDCICPNQLVNQNMITNARCGEANGAIMIMVNGDINNYQFEWIPDFGVSGAFDNERTNLPAGSYDVFVTYANKAACKEKLRLVIGNKDGLTGSILSNIPAKCGENNGQVILTPGVNYIWPNGSQSQNRTNLAPGTYEIKTLDDNGCEGALIVTVVEDCPTVCTLEVSISKIKAPDCDGNLGSIDLDISGGIAPYNFEWNIPSFGNTEDLTDLVVGDYSVTITDAKACVANAMVNLSEPGCKPPTDPDPDINPSPCNIILSLQSNNLSCDGANNGSIGVNVFNALPPYSYKWSNGAITNKIEHLSPGDYWVEVIDANGCRANSTIKITSPGRLQITETRTVLDCEGVEIKLNVANGRAPFTWSCDGLQGSLLEPLNLLPGSYNCVITDGSGCTVDHILVIEDYEPLSVTGVVKHTTCGQEDGSINLTPTGGTAPYTFAWDCGLYHDEDQFNLGPHTYNVTVTDATNCETYGTYTIEDCGGESFGFISVNAVSAEELSVQLTWETENEKMEGNYVILHSTDGENYKVIGPVAEGKGPIETAKYERKENANFGRNYFQIKYIDLIGNEYFSEITEVVISLEEITGRASIPAIIYPNPTYNEFTLDFARPIDALITVTITDIDGVLLNQVVLEPGTPKKVFDVMTYDSGIYNITLTQRRKKLKTYRLVKALE